MPWITRLSRPAPFAGTVTAVGVGEQVANAQPYAPLRPIRHQPAGTVPPKTGGAGLKCNTAPALSGRCGQSPRRAGSQGRRWPRSCSSGRRRRELLRTIDATDRQIDRLVYEFCGLTCNADMGVAEVREFCGVDSSGRGLLRAAMTQLGMSARSYHRILMGPDEL